VLRMMYRLCLVPFVWPYYVLRNLVYYRFEHGVSPALFDEMQAEADRIQAQGGDERDNAYFKLVLTKCVLSRVGLRVVDVAEDVVPWYIPLSEIQRDYRQMVEVYGYKVGL
jgi:hypothetical protein